MAYKQMCTQIKTFAREAIKQTDLPILYTSFHPSIRNSQLALVGFQFVS